MTNGNRYSLNRWLPLLAALLLISQSGCMTVYSTTVPMAVADEDLALGMDRSDVEEIINAQSLATEFAGGSLVQYRYEDFEATRLRTALYFIGGPLDLAFGLIELPIHFASQRWATGLYDLNDRLVHFVSQNAVGQRVIELGDSPDELKPTPRRHTFMDAVLGQRNAYKEKQDEDF